MNKKVYNKLVRDRIPEIIRADGGTPATRTLDEKDYFQELIRKLDEEVAEFKADCSIEELADIQEVIFALADTIASRESLETTRVHKAEQRGTFEAKIFLEDVI